ncbi:MAG: hypothetical protein PUP92_39350 [Rhizonema sp. PD38]|nr:hypothetical protein [Rhizonema sp. PD38]
MSEKVGAESFRHFASRSPEAGKEGILLGEDLRKRENSIALLSGDRTPGRMPAKITTGCTFRAELLGA